jgi:protein-S-isoprenylcysteine O-methyltransferase Ste14
MTEKILLIGLTALFIITFTTRNLLVWKRTGKSVRSRDRFVASSVVSSILCFVAVILSTNEPVYRYMGAISSIRHPFVSSIGLVLLGFSIILVWIVSAQLKDSWRVGVHEDQKTELIQDGLYAYVRNPYFLSYYVLFFGLFLVRPSMVLLLLVGVTVSTFHIMILKEEAHLLAAHGTAYREYKAKTGRYLPRFKKMAM